MHFTKTITGTVTSRVEASDLGINLDDVNPFESHGDVDISDVSIGGEVDISAFVTLRNVEVQPEDMANFDDEQALGEAVDPYGSVETEGVESEITDSPAGYSEVEAEHGEDVALSVYATLSRNGFDVI